jgi:hypothetical protein
MPRRRAEAKRRGGGRLPTRGLAHRANRLAAGVFRCFPEPHGSENRDRVWIAGTSNQPSTGAAVRAASQAAGGERQLARKEEGVHDPDRSDNH